LELKLTKNQELVLRAVYELRIEKKSHTIEHAWIEEKTITLKILGNEKKTNKVSRQQWTEPYNNTPTEKMWKRIGEAVRGRLPSNDPIEKRIRAYNSADSVLVSELKDQIVQLEARVEKAEAAKAKTNTEYEEFKSKYYKEQCTDAHYRINLKKIIIEKETLIARSKLDGDTINGLIIQENTNQKKIALLEATLSDECLKLPTDVESIKRPQFFEPKLIGRDDNLGNEELLIMYENAIGVGLDDLEKATKKCDADVTIVFHDFNIDIKTFVKEGKVPFRSVRIDNIIFACHGVSPDIRGTIYRRISALAAYVPRIVYISGKGKLEYLPINGREGVHNHDRFVTLVRTGAFRTMPINGQKEGYDTVIYRSLDDEK
jgi:hypothetical protein